MIKVLTKDIKLLLRPFGFRSEEEFVSHAVREKTHRLKALLFSSTAEKIKRGIAGARISEEKILADFERSRRA